MSTNFAVSGCHTIPDIVFDCVRIAFDSVDDVHWASVFPAEDEEIRCVSGRIVMRDPVGGKSKWKL